MRHLDPELFESKEDRKRALRNAREIEAENKATENDLEKVNKAVDRLNKLNKTERNKKAMRKVNREAQDAAVAEKNFQKEINRLPLTIKEAAEEAKLHKER